ncbi:MAG: recombinase family protein [Oscillospiraceae bacterium]|nr:recombinase family protein [Oscillospiraceae bacterium]
MFLEGKTPYLISKQLTSEGIPSPGGKSNWGATVVKSILTNEKYKGDALLQKVFTIDFLTKKKKINEREVPQYYVEGNHPAIIPPKVHEMVQLELERRSKNGRHSGMHLFSGRIKCGHCGSWYGSKVWHSNSKYRKTIWQCNHKFDGDEKCQTPYLTDENVKGYFISALNTLMSQKDEVIADVTESVMPSFDTSALETERDNLRQDAQMLVDAVQKIIYENAHTALAQSEYQSSYDTLTARYEATKAKLENINGQISDKKGRQASIKEFLDTLSAQETSITEFEQNAWCGLVDFITVYDEDDVRVTFKNGMEIKA